jgi:Holliday junction resolvase RusA-like endonuclease
MSMTEVPQVIVRTWVGGRPRTKGSLKAYCSRGRDHKLVWKEQVAESKPWRTKVAATVQREARAAHGRDLKLDVPLELRAIYWFRREDEDLPDGRRPTAMTTGDLDKLDRNILDALTSSGVIKDDRFIVRIMSEKRWAAPGGLAGVQLLLMPVPAEEQAILEGAVYWAWHEGLEVLP